MLLWHRLKALWRNLTRNEAVDRDLDDEIRSYREMLEDEKSRYATDPRAARREALFETGGAEQIKEQVRDVRMGATLTGISAELRQSFRGLRRNPTLAILGTLMLALSIGAGALVFSIVHAALINPLPFRDPERLVQLWETRMDRGINQASFAAANFWDVRARNHSFEEVATYHYDEANMTGNGPAEKVTFIEVSAGFFRTLGVSPALGRDFAYDDERPGVSATVALVGNRFWKNQLNADPQILGKALRLNDRPYTIVGVLPPGEPWLNEQIYVPFGFRPNEDRSSFEFEVIGRLAGGVTATAAQADLRSVARSLAAEYPKDDSGIGFHMESAQRWVANDTTRRALWILLGAVTSLLLIACLNLANLLLARGLSRTREIVVRAALGAGRGRLIRFVLMESLLICGFGAALGLGLASFTLKTIQASGIGSIPRLEEARLNPWVLGATVLAALIVGVLAGLAPALQAPATALASALREGDRSQAGARGHRRLRAGLVASEVALSFLLLVGAGLLIRSFNHLMSVDRGFRTDSRVVFSLSMPGSYWEKGAGKAFLDRFFERLAHTPQIISVGAVSHRPVEGGNPGMGIDSAAGKGISRGRTLPWASWRVVTPGYFRALGLPLLKGRDFEESDKPVWSEPGQPVPLRRVVISERLARLIFPDADAIGRHVTLWKSQSNLDAEVAGVVGDMRERGPASNPTLAVYLPWGRNALPGEFVIHSSAQNPLELMPGVRSIVNSLDPNLPIADVRSLEEVVERSVAPQRFNAMLLGIFSGLALLLATAGIYGVLSYAMSQRTAEIGLRVALGASRGSILGMAIDQGMRPALLGIAFGAVGAWWLSRYFVKLLFGVAPFDVSTYGAVASLLLATALAACYLPARRAMGTDPVVALRVE